MGSLETPWDAEPERPFPMVEDGIMPAGTVFSSRDLPEDEIGWCPTSWKVQVFDGEPYLVEWCNISSWKQIRQKDVFTLRAERVLRERISPWQEDRDA